MKLVQHPHVVRLYEVIDTATKLYLILELADGGDMYDYIMKHDEGLQEDAAKKYFRQVGDKKTSTVWSLISMSGILFNTTCHLRRRKRLPVLEFFP